MFVGLAFITPSISYAQTAPSIEEQRVALIEQLIELLQQKVAVLIAQLEAQQAEITTLKTNQPVFGGTTPMTDTPTPFTITATVEFGKGSWEERDERCNGGRDDGTFDCANDFLDGKVKFTVDKPYKSAMLTYGTSKENSTTLPLDIDIRTGQKGLTGQHGYFQPNTTYFWSIDAVNEAGEKAHTEGSFKTGKY